MSEILFPETARYLRFQLTLVGANLWSILQGSLDDHASLVDALKQVDVVISAVSHPEEQFPLIEAIKEAGTIKVQRNSTFFY